MKRNYFIILLASVLLLILVGLLVAKNNSKVNSSQSKLGPQTVSLKGFKSNNLDFSVQLPHSYEVIKGVTYLDFKKDVGSIGVSRIGSSDFNNLNDFLTYADNKNNLKNFIKVKEMEINGYPTVVRMEIRGGIEYKMYYIYIDNWVYVFSTQSKPLYDNLDQIAQSFRYTP